jgi:hypothetical protein
MYCYSEHKRTARAREHSSGHKCTHSEHKRTLMYCYSEHKMNINVPCAHENTLVNINVPIVNINVL